MSTLKVNTIQDTTGNDALTIDSSGNVTASQGFVPSTQLSHRNLIINGAMQVAQRGTSSTSAGYGSVDRFELVKEGLSQFVFTQSQSTTSPDNFTTSFKINTDTAEASLDSGDLIRLRHSIEAQNLQHLGFGTSAAKSFTVSFWVRSSVTGTYAMHFYRPDNTVRNITANYSVSSADTWEYKTITIVGDTSQVINNDNGAGLNVYWVLRAGSTFTASDASSWENWDYTGLAYGHTAEWGSATNDTFHITGIQLEVGSVATPFEHRSYGEELARCQRYYYTCSDSGYRVGRGNGTSNLANVVLLTPVPMRATPSISNNSGTWYAIDSDTYTNGTGATFSNINLCGSHLDVQVSNLSGMTDNRFGMVSFGSGYSLDAEL